MKLRNLFIVALALTICAAAASAQAPRRRNRARSAAAKPTPTPAPLPDPTPTAQVEPASPTLAIVNDISITAADIDAQVSATLLDDPDPYLRLFYQDPQREIKDARVRAVDARIGSLLVEAEAKKRGLIAQDFLDREINNKVTPPTEAEIKATYDNNRDQLGTVDFEKVRPGIIGFLREQRKQELYNALMNRLKLTNSVVKHADVNAPNLAPGTVLAAVNSQPIRIETINERMKAYVYKLEMQIYDVQKKVLDRRINDLLLVADASKRNIGSEQIVRTEITDKLTPPTEAEIAKFYEENKARISDDLASARPGIINYLQQQQQEKLETALSEKLRTGAKLQIFLKQPEPAVFNVSAHGPARGDVNAAVTIIEFTDFQCSSCGAMYSVLEDALKSYGHRVRFVVRNFPLTQVHANAFRAAQAASAANAQDKFWEYIDLLFKNQNALDVDSLKKYATQIGLDRKRFDAELDSGKYDAEIRRDIEDGQIHGVEGTPTIFINGVLLTPPEFSADGLRAAIERAFKRVPKPRQ